MDIIRTENDFHTSLEKALEEIDPHWRKYTGVVILGTHAPEMVDEKLDQIKWAREKDIPCLGICMGMQLMLIEYARNVAGKADANTTEINPDTTTPVVIKMDKLRVGNFGGESFWHNYMFNENYLDLFPDWMFSGFKNVTDKAVLPKNRFHVGTQYHPEYQSSEFNPHPVLKEFIYQCKKYGNAE